MRIYLRVTEDFGLVPVSSDEKGVKYLYNRKVGDILTTDVKVCRNYENLQRFMVFIKTTFDMQEFFDNKESYRYWLTMKAGYFDTIVTPAGKTIFKAHSISFADMEEDEFKKVFSNCIDVFLKEFGQGQTENDILQVIGFS